jgi:hypothetical protein
VVDIARGFRGGLRRRDGVGLAEHSFGWGLAAGFSVTVLALFAGPVATGSVAIWGATGAHSRHLEFSTLRGALGPIANVGAGRIEAHSRLKVYTSLPGPFAQG